MTARRLLPPLPRRRAATGAPSDRRRAHRWWLARRALAGALALATTVGVVLALAPRGPQEAGVVVAAADLPAGHLLQERDVELVGLPRDAVGPWAVTDPAALVGRPLTSPVAAGEVLSTARVATAGLLDSLPEGMQLSHLELGDPAVARAVQPGDRVEVRVRGGAPGARRGEGASVPAALVVASTPESEDAPAGLWLAVTPEEAAALAGADSPDGAPSWVVSVLRREPSSQ